MLPSVPTRRAESRFGVRYPGRVRSLDGGSALTGRVEDISAGGVRFHTTQPLPAGTELLLEIELPSKPPAQVQVRVIWARRSDELITDHPFILGLEQQRA